MSDRCKCGGVILADTEDWKQPLCHDCYEYHCLNKKLATTEKLLALAEDKLNFYQDRKNWGKQTQVTWTIIHRSDYEFEEGAVGRVGGKRARKYYAEKKKILEKG